MKIIGYLINKKYKKKLGNVELKINMNLIFRNHYRAQPEPSLPWAAS